MIAIHGRAAAGRQQHGLGGDETEFAGAHVDQQHAGERAVLRRDQRDGAMLFEPPDRPRPHLFHQPVDDLDAGEVALVHGAIEGLAGEGLAVERAVGIAVEEAADLVFQFLHPLDRLGDQRPGQLLVRQPFAAFDGVHEMALDEVAGIERDVVATLHHAGAAAFAEQTLADDGDVEIGIGLQGMQRRKQAGAAGAEDQNVGLEVFDVHGAQNTRAKKYEGDDRRYRRRERRQLLLAVAPIEVLDHQNAQTAEQMNREQKDQPAFGKFHQRLIGPAQEAFELCFAVDGQPKRQEMQRQENRQARDPTAGAPWLRSTARCRDA